MAEQDVRMTNQLELDGRVALVTGASDVAGIGWAVATRLHQLGATVVVSGWPDDDHEDGSRRPPIDGPNHPASARFLTDRRDLDDPSAPTRLIDDVVEEHGRIDIVVAAHARSSSHPLSDVTPDELDGCWATNVRSIVLLAQRFAACHEQRTATPPAGRMIWFTSGQHLGPMVDEIAYAISKGALHQMTGTLSRALESAGIVANCINPGPVDTGWADGQTHDALARRFPDEHWTTPAQTAELVAFLVSDAGAVIRGQILDAEAGFNRFADS